MDPYHFSILFQFYDTFGECTVDIDISLPQFLSSLVIFEVIKAFEVVEKWSQHCFMEI